MLPEPWNSMALVVLGALLGAWAFGTGCGCLARWRWRRSCAALNERQAVDFCEAGHTARFIAQQVEQRSQQRARELARRAGTEGAR